MKTMTVRLPERLAAEIAAEARLLNVSKSDVIRDRLQRATEPTARPTMHDLIADLIGSVDDDLPADVSARTDHYLEATGFGLDRPRRHRLPRRTAAE